MHQRRRAYDIIYSKQIDQERDAAKGGHWRGDNINTDELEFAVFCVERVAEKLNTTGEHVYKMMTDESDTLDNYIIPCYEALHTQGEEYIVRDLLGYMEARGAKP